MLFEAAQEQRDHSRGGAVGGSNADYVMLGSSASGGFGSPAGGSPSLVGREDSCSSTSEMKELMDLNDLALMVDVAQVGKEYSPLPRYLAPARYLGPALIIPVAGVCSWEALYWLASSRT